MSKFQWAIKTNMPEDLSLHVCHQAIAQMGLLVMESSNQYIVCKEQAVQSTSYTWAGKLSIRILADPKGSKIDVTGTIFGAGPIQYDHIHGLVGKFINQVQTIGYQYSLKIQDQTRDTPIQSPQNKSNIGSELEKLSSLLNSGHISQEEFNAVKNKLLSQ